MAVPIAEPLSFGHGGTNTSANRAHSRQRLFQSQFRPQPPAISSGYPLVSTALATVWKASNTAAEWCAARLAKTCDVTPTLQNGDAASSLFGLVNKIERRDSTQSMTSRSADVIGDPSAYPASAISLPALESRNPPCIASVVGSASAKTSWHLLPGP